MRMASPLFYFALWLPLGLLAFALSRATGWGSGPADRASTEFYRPIEGLRGILAMNVFFHHSLIAYVFMSTGNWDPPLSVFYGELGPGSVKMFFFITGFLFWTKAIKSPDSLRTLTFFKRRFLRLMPAYWGSLCLILLSAARLSHFRLLVPAGTLASELLTWLTCGVPLDFTDINSIYIAVVNANVCWSLRVEWFFYLALPFLAWFATKKRVGFLLLLTAGIFAAFAAIGPLTGRLDLAADPLRTLATYMATSFSVGMITAHLKAKWPSWPLLRHPGWIALALLLLLAVMLFNRAGIYYPESLLLAPIFVLIVYGNDFGGLLTSRPITYLGTISYSVYLLHGIVLFSVSKLTGLLVNFSGLSPVAYWSFVGCEGVLVIFVASLSYYALEKPFIGKRI